MLACGGSGAGDGIEADAAATSSLCDPVTQSGCEPGEKCTWIIDEDNGAFSDGHTGCTTAGSVGAGASSCAGSGCVAVPDKGWSSKVATRVVLASGRKNVSVVPVEVMDCMNWNSTGQNWVRVRNTPEISSAQFPRHGGVHPTLLSSTSSHTMSVHLAVCLLTIPFGPVRPNMPA